MNFKIIVGATSPKPQSKIEAGANLLLELRHLWRQTLPILNNLPETLPRLYRRFEVKLSLRDAIVDVSVSVRKGAFKFTLKNAAQTITITFDDAVIRGARFDRLLKNSQALLALERAFHDSLSGAAQQLSDVANAIDLRLGDVALGIAEREKFTSDVLRVYIPSLEKMRERHVVFLTYVAILNLCVGIVDNTSIGSSQREPLDKLKRTLNEIIDEIQKIKSISDTGCLIAAQIVAKCSQKVPLTR